jgi:hypothetical protein
VSLLSDVEGVSDPLKISVLTAFANGLEKLVELLRLLPFVNDVECRSGHGRFLGSAPLLT